MIVLQAQWMEENRILVIYHMNGATSPAITDADVLVTDEVILHTPSRTGYTFRGWNLVNKGNGENPNSPVVAGSIYQDLAATDARFIILEAQWEAREYEVNYDVNDDGDFTNPANPQTISPKTVYWNDNGLVPPGVGDPRRDHYVFMGWNTEPLGMGTSVYAGTTYAQLAVSDNVDEITLYAKWIKERTYLVRYNLNGGSQPGTPITNKTLSDPSEKVPLLPEPVPPAGYKFTHWNVSVNGSKTGVGP